MSGDDDKTTKTKSNTWWSSSKLRSARDKLSKNSLEGNSPMVVAKGSRLRRSILDEIEEHCYRFKGSSSKEADEARETLLDLLDWLLKIGHAVRDTKTCRRLIVGVLRRREFSLEHIGFGVGVAEQLPASESSLNLLSRFRKSLAHCVLFCGNLIDRKWIKGKIAFKFCNQVLAIAFFRLPIAGLIIKLQQQHQEQRLSNNKRTLNEKDAASQKRIDARYQKYKKICKRLSANHNTCTSFINANPSLYSWNWFTSQWDLKFQEVLARKEKQTKWLSSMLASSEGFPCFLNEYVRHVCLVCAGPVMWTVIPGYDGMIDLFYREFADCGRHLCSSRSTLREWSTHECRVNLETSCQVVVNTRLVNVMMLLAYENCNIHNLKDVENTISLIEMWLTVLSTKGQMYDSKTPPELIQICTDLRRDVLTSGVGQRFEAADALEWIKKHNETTTTKEDDPHDVLDLLEHYGLVERADDKISAEQEKNLTQNGIAVGVLQNETYRFVDDKDFRKKENQKLGPRLPTCFDFELFSKGIVVLLSSSHFQVVLKALSFLYNHEVIFHGPLRVNLVEDILLKKNFNRLFMHWMYEVRRYMQHILVYRIFRTSRLWIPLRTDEQLVSEAESKLNAKSNSISRGYRETMRLVSMCRRSREKTGRRGSGFFGTLFDAVVRPSKAREEHEQARQAFFSESLEEEEKALDLLLASKLDSFLQCVLLQSRDPSQKFFDSKFQPYAERSIKEYTQLLVKYYEDAWKQPSYMVKAPDLTFTVIDGK